MSKDSPITMEDRWFQGEDKLIEFAVVDANGAAQNMTGWTLLWKLFRTNKITTVMSKIPTTFNIAGTLDGARVAIADTDTVNASGAVVVQAGLYWHELWKTNEGDEQLLASGDAWLRPSGRRQETS